MKILAKVLSLRSDRTNYKVYSPELEPQDVFVEIEDDSITGHQSVGSDKIILDLNGFTALLDIVATSIDHMHVGYQRRVQAGTN